MINVAYVESTLDFLKHNNGRGEINSLSTGRLVWPLTARCNDLDKSNKFEPFYDKHKIYLPGGCRAARLTA